MEMLVAYSRLASGGSEAERGEREAEVRLFVESIWADASAEGRSRFMDAVRGSALSMPWAAVVESASGAQEPTVDPRGPAALELIVGQADPDDEGVATYRIDATTEAGKRAFEALMRWDLVVVSAIAASAGWHLDRIDAAPLPTMKVEPAGAGEVSGDDGEDAVIDAIVPGEGQEEPAPSGPLPWGLIVGGLGLMAAVGLAWRERGQ
ncbi:MAG: hypothetical protein KC420_02695 [Myxococcales bacterium]|nr:hypothetical protein [Myxococcales bacterium]